MWGIMKGNSVTLLDMDAKFEAVACCKIFFCVILSLP